ncbi:unnamed protein product, partial [Amoebophrya sp. A25]
DGRGRSTSSSDSSARSSRARESCRNGANNAEAENDIKQAGKKASAVDSTMRCGLPEPEVTVVTGIEDRLPQFFTTSSTTSSLESFTWTALALCHTCRRTGGQNGVLSSASPEEIALVNASSDYGAIHYAEFLEAEQAFVLQRQNGDEEDCRVEVPLLGICDFSSERKRMSVIVRCPQSKRLVLFSKGADSVMLDLARASCEAVSTDNDEQRIADSVLDFSRVGLRTLVLGYKLLTEEEFRDWKRKKDIEMATNSNYRRNSEKNDDDTTFKVSTGKMKPEASALTEDDEKELMLKSDSTSGNSSCSAADAQLERGLHLLGCVAIEDALAVGVPETIAALYRAKIPVWVCTGDKTETAVAVARSCGIVEADWEGVFLTSGADIESDTCNTVVSKDRNDPDRDRFAVITGDLFADIIAGRVERR